MEVNQILYGDVKSVSIHGDCEIGMESWADKFFGLAVPDPPYFSGPETGKFYGGVKSTTNVNRVQYNKIESWRLPSDKFFTELFRVSDNQIIWGANYYEQLGPVHNTPRRHELAQWLAEHPIGWIVWDKVTTAPSFNDFELAWTSYDKPTVVFPFMWGGMMQGKSVREGHIMQGNKKLNQKRIHQTQKPFEIYHWCYVDYANYAAVGKPILDTHLGSQSSRIVAYKLGFDFYGYEITEHYFITGNQRFVEHTRMPLFDLTI